ncbi:MAG: tyrosine-protein phosphatase [Novosphingobium sp.]|nr:tyrosine-protein phosphatase [Novosphingobium sp.]
MRNCHVRLAALLLIACPAWVSPVLAEDVQQVVEPPRIDKRFIAVEGGRNFRDAGGYATADGRVVRRDVLYRSGSLGSLSLNGQQTVSGLGVTSIIDLRTVEERHQDMSNWLSVAGLGYWSRDYSMSMGDMRSLFSDPANLTRDGVHGMMTEAYRRLPFEQAPAYRELFTRLEQGKGPVVVNCTAGKDRTGVATALVLTALGVPYDTVRQDFLLSNGAPGMDTLAGSSASPLAGLPPEVLAPLSGVDGGYLDAAFAAITAKHGGVPEYLEAELGVGPKELATLRKRMLE